MKGSSFHVLSFEGPDAYSRAGGIATRITGLAHAVAASGHATNLWFVGDPELPGHEEIAPNLQVHRWCQWISAYHLGGVYDGEHGKVSDYAASLPPWLVPRMAPTLLEGGHAVVLAEEWHTAPAVLHLDHLLRRAGLRERVSILWNANNTFGFERIDWGALQRAATITTVSRYMRTLMRGELGVDPLVIPNGLDAKAFAKVDGKLVREFRRRTRGRTVLAKVARFDPDKNWLLAVDVVHALKQGGDQPLLLARGGSEAHGHEVFERAKTLGLDVRFSKLGQGARGVLAGLDEAAAADVLVVDSFLDDEAKRLLFRASTGVLVNSAHEPFGLVGLEAMAVGGLAFTGCTGEDYAVPGSNALVVQTDDPQEIVGALRRLEENPSEAKAIRREAKRTAKRFAWPEVVERSLFPRVRTAH